ncbi:MAG: hypothetical protein Roseis2KO_54430 [Roseivirga sp.]
MLVLKRLYLNWQSRQTQWGIIFLIAALMTNLGYGTNLLLALQCEQYYFEYLLFFTLVYGAKALSDQVTVAKELKAVWKAALSAGMLISITFFGILWVYNVLTNCPFEPVQFLTSRMPLIMLLSGLYQYWRFNQAGKESGPAIISVKTVNNGLLRLQKDEVACASLENGLLRLSTTQGERHWVDTSLKALQQQLDDDEQFYRLNRTTLVHRNQVGGFSTNEKHQLSITLKSGETVTVNKNKVKAFKNWLALLPS